MGRAGWSSDNNLCEHVGSLQDCCKVYTLCCKIAFPLCPVSILPSTGRSSPKKKGRLRAHTHRYIGYRNNKPQSLAESAATLMYLRIYDSRDSSSKPEPSPSLCSLLTHTQHHSHDHAPGESQSHVLRSFDFLRVSDQDYILLTRIRLTV